MPTVQDIYKAQVLAGTPFAYYLCDEASGNLIDSSGHGRDMTLGSGANPATYGLTGPFQGAKAIRCVNSGGNHCRYNFDFPGESIGTECISMEAWVYLETTTPSNPCTFLHGFNFSLYLSSGSIAPGGGGRFMQGVAEFITILPASSFQVTVNQWHYLSLYHVDTGENLYVDDAVVEDCGVTTTIATPYAQLSLGSYGPFGAPDLSLLLSNVAFFRGCPTPVNFPPPSAFLPQIYRRVIS